MRRITPRTCLWPLVGCISASFVLSIGLTFRSNHHCYAGTCGEWLFPFEARLHVVVWYVWLSLSISFLALRAFQPRIRNAAATTLGAIEIPLLGKRLRVSGILLVFWICVLYGALFAVWWVRLKHYFYERGPGLPGNGLVAAVALVGHVADVTMGMVLLPVSRHSALASFFRLSPSTIYIFHLTMAYILISMVVVHGLLYAAWVALYNEQPNMFEKLLPVLNPTYLYNEVWPGDKSGLGIWRASLIFTGIAASLIMLAMLLTSFPFIRRKHFNLFYFTHLLGILAVVIICLHASTMLYCTLPGLSMWLLDWSMRVVELREQLPSRLVALGNGWYRYASQKRNWSLNFTDYCSITLPLPRKRLSGCACHSPLAHFYIHHTQSSIREVHPFTTVTHLASTKRTTRDDEEFISVQFLFRASLPDGENPKKPMQWTSRLGSLADEELEKSPVDPERDPGQLEHHDWKEAVSLPGVNTNVRLEGPYFSPSNPERFKTVVCLVAGTGLSGAIAMAAAFKAQRSSQQTTLWQRCFLIWTVRERNYTTIPLLDGMMILIPPFQRPDTDNSSRLRMRRI